MRFIKIFVIGALCLAPLPTMADDSALIAGNVGGIHLSRPDAHAPIGVMGDHVHEKGEWMFSYRYMYMFMGESKVGDDEISDTDVLKRFTITPQDMTMQMHMIGAMYAPEDWITFSAMLPIIRKDMNHINRAGVEFRTNSEGLGDIKLNALFPFWKEGAKQFHANFGLSLPTGSINEIDDIPLGKGKRLPYPMQLGSGTWDLLPGITYNEQLGDWSWGAQGTAGIRLGRNRIGYSLGNEYDVNFWIQKLLAEDLSIGSRLNYSIWSNIDGSDTSQVATLVPTADHDSRGGKRIDLLFGVNYYPKEGPLKGNRLAFEAGFPVYENLDGPQLSTDLTFTIGWQKVY